MIRLEEPAKFSQVTMMAREVALNTLRPVSRKYDRNEHTYPVELNMFESIMNGMEDGGTGLGAGGAVKDKSKRADDGENRNGKNMQLVLNTIEMCYGDAGLLLTIPGQGLGNAAIATVATPEQKERFNRKWAAMAITEPGAGSDSSAIRTTAEKTDKGWLLNGEKIFVTCGERAELVVVWATLDKSQGKAAIKSFGVEKGTPGMKVEKVEDKLGIRASDTATIVLQDCLIPHDNILGSEEIDTKKSFAGAMQTFDNTRPLVAAMAVGVARAAIELTRDLFLKHHPSMQGVWPGTSGSNGSSKEQARAAAEERLYARPDEFSPAWSRLLKLEAELETARLLTLKAAYMADNNMPNSKEASMAKAKAGRVGNEITLACVEILGPLGYSEDLLVEKWARDSKIFDIFEGTQQIQQLIIARRVLDKSSKELR